MLLDDYNTSAAEALCENIPERTDEAAPMLHVLVRGEAFRKSRTGIYDRSRDTNGDPEEQQHALRTLERYVLAPAENMGWRTAISFDIVIHEPQAAQEARRRIEQVQRLKEMICGRTRRAARSVCAPAHGARA